MTDNERIATLRAALEKLLAAQAAVSRIRNDDAERLDYDGAVDEARVALAPRKTKGKRKS